MTTFTLETFDPQIASGVRFEVPMAELPNVFGRGFAAVAQAAASPGIALIGPPFAFCPRMPTDTIEVIAGFPVAAPIAAEVERFELPGGASSPPHTSGRTRRRPPPTTNCSPGRNRRG